MSTVYFSLTSHICFLPAIPLSFLISYSYILSLFSYQAPFSFLIFSPFLKYHFSHTLTLLFLYIFVLILSLFPLTSIPFYSLLFFLLSLFKPAYLSSLFKHLYFYSPCPVSFYFHLSLIISHIPHHFYHIYFSS